MGPRRPSRRPAFGAALSLLAGVALGAGAGRPLAEACVAAALCGAAASIAFPRSRHAGLCLLLLAGGVVLEAGERNARDGRIRAFLAQGRSEREVEGVLVAPPEPQADGTWTLLLRVDPRRSEAEGLRLRLRVAATGVAATQGLDGLVHGARIRAWVRLSDPLDRARERALAAQGIDLAGAVKSARLIEVRAPGSGIRARLDRLKALARRRLVAALDTDRATCALAQAMLLGDRQALDARHTQELRGSGLLHLVSISGLHVGLLALAGLVLLRRLRLPAPAALPLLIGSLAALAHLVGGRPPVLRAVVGACLLEVARVCGRAGEPLNSLAVVLCTIVVFAPAALADPALQLSFLATAGLLVGAKDLTRCFPLPRPLAHALALSSGAYLATAPLCAWWFGRLAPVGLLTNLFAAPLCGCVLASGYAAMLTHGAPVLGFFFAWLAQHSLVLLMAIASVAQGLPGGNHVVARPSTTCLVVFYTCAALAVFGARLPRAPRRATCLGLALATLAIHVGPIPSGGMGARAAVLDVGQGLSVVARADGAAPIVIDAGGVHHPTFDPGERIVEPFLLGWSGARLEALILSHEHEDHCGGAAALLRDLEVGELWLPVGYARSGRLRDLAALARVRGVAVVLVQRGWRAHRARLAVELLGPARDQLHLPANERSIVLRLGAAPCRLLVPGDIGEIGERSVIEGGAALRAEALVVPHHGSRRASGDPLLSRVRATDALVSAGRRNRFGHPDSETLERLSRWGSRIWRTDRDGTLQLHCTAEGWVVSPTRRPSAGESE